MKVQRRREERELDKQRQEEELQFLARERAIAEGVELDKKEELVSVATIPFKFSPRFRQFRHRQGAMLDTIKRLLGCRGWSVHVGHVAPVIGAAAWHHGHMLGMLCYQSEGNMGSMRLHAVPPGASQGAPAAAAAGGAVQRSPPTLQV